MDEKKRTTDDISGIAQSILKAIKSPEATGMEESKEKIFQQVSQRIGTVAEVPSDRRMVHRLYPYTWIAASVTVLLFISFFAYQHYHGRAAFPAVLWQEAYALKGEQKELTLSDGTIVTLNGGSSLIYPSTFANGRQVFLQGEGYFDVVKAEQHPFIVQSRLLAVKVWGTRFSLKSYHEDPKIVLTLETGSVTATLDEPAQSITLSPNQQLTFDNKTKKIECKEVDAADYTSWRNGVLIFREQTLEDIALTLERQFGVRIEIASDKLRKERYGASFKHGESLEDILDKLSQRRSWTYKKENGSFLIAPS